MKKNNIGKWLYITLPILAAAYILWPTYNYYRLDQERQAVASDSARLANWDAANNESYVRARRDRMKLGLDLRGGMYVTLEVDVLKLIEESAEPASIDDDFNAILTQTRAETDNTDLDVLPVFLRNFKNKGKSLLSYFSAISNEADITEQGIEDRLRQDVDAAVDQALEVMTQRINKFEVSEANIQKQGARRILLELPDVKDETEIRSLIQGQARLEFKRVVEGRDILLSMFMLDKLMRGEAKADTTVATLDSAALAKQKADSAAKASQVASDKTKAKSDKTKTDTAKGAAQQDSTAVDSAKTDSIKDPYAGLAPEEAARRFKADHPFTSMISIVVQGQQEAMSLGALAMQPERLPETMTYSLFTDGATVPKIRRLLTRPDVKRFLPSDFVIMIGAHPARESKEVVEADKKIYEVFTLAEETELTGEVISDAFPSFDNATNRPMVIMDMDDDGSEKWSQITGANIGKKVAVVLDSQVYTAPTIQDKIPNGRSQITGMANQAEATRLGVVLKAGALKAPVRIIEERVVGPSLGEDSIRRGVTSSLISFALVILFMLAYYAIGGAVADIALLMNVLLVVAGLAAFGGTITLPGIAGLILSTAMAVDANILIFERIREELAVGRTLKMAVENGYQKAWSAIFDSNVTHLISGLVLYFLGTGPIKGFALTWIIGVLMTLFTAVVVTRAILELAIARGATTFNFGQKKNPVTA